MTNRIGHGRVPLIASGLFLPEARRGIAAGLLSSVSTYKEHVLFGFAAPHVTKDASLGEIGAGIAPDTRGRYQLQLAGILPELLPTPGTDPEYCVRMAIRRDTYVQLAVSNQMARLRYRRDSDDWHALLPCYALEKSWPNIPQGCPVEPLRTVVAWTSVIRGQSVEEALEQSIDERTDTFAQLANLFLRAQRSAKQIDAANVLTPVLRRDSFAYFYFLVTGVDPAKPLFGRVSANLFLSGYRSAPMESDAHDRFVRFVRDPSARDPSDEMLRSAFTHARAGELAYSLMLAVMVAETATARFVRQRLESRGVARGKIKESQKELTYNHMLNFFVPALLPHGSPIDPSVSGTLNRARKLRNDVVHEGRDTLDPRAIDEILEATALYVGFLDTHS